MEIKYFVVLTFAASILGMWLSTNQAGKNLVSEAEKRISEMSKWKQFFYAILDIYPQHLLNQTGKKWQRITYLLLITAFVSGIYIGHLAKN